MRSLDGRPCGLLRASGPRGRARREGRLNVTRRRREETAPARPGRNGSLGAAGADRPGQGSRARQAGHGMVGTTGRTRHGRHGRAAPPDGGNALLRYTPGAVDSRCRSAPPDPVWPDPVWSGRRRTSRKPASRNSRLKQLPAQLGQTFLRAPMRIRLREHIRNIYCRARLPACGAGGRRGQGATSSGTEPPCVPAASDCGKAGCMRAKSGPRLQFAGRGPFAGVPAGAKVHGMIARLPGRVRAPSASRRTSAGPHGRTTSKQQARPLRAGGRQ